MTIWSIRSGNSPGTSAGSPVFGKKETRMAEQNFEKALVELEGIVDKLEGGDLKLNESLGLFEKGVKLARYLRNELDKAERKIEILLKDEKGEVKAQPFSEVSDNTGAVSEEAESPDDEDSEPGDNTLPF